MVLALRWLHQSCASVDHKLKDCGPALYFPAISMKKKLFFRFFLCEVQKLIKYRSFDSLINITFSTFFYYDNQNSFYISVLVQKKHRIRACYSASTCMYVQMREIFLLELISLNR